MNYEQIQKINNENKVLILKKQQSESEIVELVQNQRFHEMVNIRTYFDDSKSEIIGQQLIQLNQLINLKIYFSSDELNSFHQINVFGQNLKHLQKLNYLQIQIYGRCQDMSLSKDISEIGIGLSHLNNLKYFSLELDKTSILAKQGAKAIRKGLQNLKQLSGIYYYLYFNNSENDFEILEQLCKGFKYYNNLKHLRITTTKGQRIGDEGLEQILIRLKYLVNLESVNLSFYNQNKNFRTTIDQQCIQSIISLKKLAKFKLYTSYHLQEVNILYSLSECLLSLENLQQFEIFSNQCLKKNESFIFGKNVNPNSQLKELTLQLSYDSDENQIIFSNDLENLKNLQTFKLIIKNNRMLIDEQNIKSLAKFLKNNQNMEYLVISITSLLSFNSFLMIAQCIGSLQNLSSLVLYISYENTQKDQTCLINEISKLSLLKKLTLQINFFSFVILEDGQEFDNEEPQFLHNLVNLKEFTYYEQLDSKNSLLIVGENLKNFTNLELLNLQLKCLSDENQFKALSEGFQYLTNLKSLQIGDNNQFEEKLVNSQSALLLFKGIAKINSLYELQIQVNLEKNNELAQLQKEIGKNLKSLKRLRVIYFYDLEESYGILRKIMFRKMIGLVQII